MVLPITTGTILALASIILVVWNWRVSSKLEAGWSNYPIGTGNLAQLAFRARIYGLSPELAALERRRKITFLLLCGTYMLAIPLMFLGDGWVRLAILAVPTATYLIANIRNVLHDKRSRDYAQSASEPS